METTKNKFEEMEKAKKKFEDLSYILRLVIGELKTPLSVSFFNTEFSSKFKREIKSEITLNFMKLFKDEFLFNVIGADIKVHLKDKREQPFNKEYHAIAEKVKKIFLKDSIKLDDIKRKMMVEKRMLYDKFCKDFSSNKYSINLPSVNRNSHKLKLKAEDGQTYVEISEDDNIFIDEIKFWEIIEEKGFEELVLRILINLFSKFYQELDQGKLQVCFKYDIAIDRLFMIKHDRYFVRTGLTKFKLKEEYRESSESLVTTSTTSENRNIVPCADNKENLLHEMEAQETTSEMSSTVDRDTTSEAEIQSSNENTDSEDDLVTDTNFTSDDTDSESDDTLEDEISKEAEVNLEEKKKKQWSDKKAVRNEKRLGGTNTAMNLLSPWTRKGEEKGEKSEMDITDGSYNPALIRKYSKKKSETYEQIKNAVKSGRPVIISGKRDMEPLIIGLSSIPEKRRQQLRDIGVFILNEMQK